MDNTKKRTEDFYAVVSAIAKFIEAADAPSNINEEASHMPTPREMRLAQRSEEA